MPEFLDKPTLSLSQQQELIQAFPCFSSFSPAQTRALAQLLREFRYAKGETIVKEGELVDAVYIIASGEVEVTHEAEYKNRKTQIPLSILRAKEAIGLNDTGFFSSTGKRTATVAAVKDSLLLRLDLKDLHGFLKEHQLESSMYKAAEQMLRIRLIKQSLPFSKLDHERLLWLAEHVEQIKVPAGRVLFHQGDQGESCYLIRSGQVEVIATEVDGHSHSLATLKPPTLFGEATLITQTPRNATVRAIEDSELLVLSYTHLTELLEKEGNVADMFMTLMVDRSRPSRNDKVKEYPRTTPEGNTIVILKDPEHSTYFKLSPEGWFIWQQLDGQQTLLEITMGLASQFQVFAPNMVVAIISKLARAGFVVNVSTESLSTKKQSWFARTFAKIRQLLEIRIVFRDADPWLSKLYNRGVYLLFTRFGQILLGLVILAGTVAFFITENAVVTLLRGLPNSWLLFVAIFPLMVLTVSLHELGHAFMTKSFGHEVHYMGVGWYWTGPVAFTDTSDMWLEGRWRRIAVNAAGIYANLLVASLAALAIPIMPSQYGQAFLWLFALMTYINGFTMLNPLQEMDGYYILMDLSEEPHLRRSAILWLMKQFPSCCRRPALFLKYGAELGYWLACIAFLVVTALITLYVQAFILKLLGLKPPNAFVALLLPLLTAGISGLTIVSEIRNQKD